MTTDAENTTANVRPLEGDAIDVDPAAGPGAAPIAGQSPNAGVRDAGTAPNAGRSPTAAPTPNTSPRAGADSTRANPAVDANVIPAQYNGQANATAGDQRVQREASYAAARVEVPADHIGQAMFYPSPGQTATLTLTGVATSEQPLSFCTLVDYKPSLCLTNIPVTKPNLELVGELVWIEAEGRASLVCEAANARFVVRNAGSGELRDVTLTVDLPDGLQVGDQPGRDPVQVPIGSLSGGQAREVVMALQAQRAGRFQFQGVAREAGGQEAQTRPLSFNVQRPQLEIALEGPDREFINKTTEYTVTVRNTGDVVARDTQVQVRVPQQLEYLRGGRLADGRSTWAVGTLEPGQSKSGEIVFRGRSEGTLTLQAVAQAYCAEAAQTQQQLVLSGIPALLLEVVDSDFDPVPIGQPGRYVLQVKNQGSAADTQIQLTATLPDQMRFKNVEGPTQVANRSGNTITLEPVSELPPGRVAEWMIHTEVVEAGQGQIQVDLKSNKLQQPMRETEATTSY